MRSKKAFKNSIFALLLVGTSVIAGFIVPRAIIEAFGSAEYGLTVSIANFLGYLFLLRAGLGGVVKAALYKPLAERNQAEIELIMHTTEHWFQRIIRISMVYMGLLSILMTILVKGSWGFGFVTGMVAVIGLGVLGRYYWGAPYQLLVAADQKEFVYSIFQILAILANTLMVILLVRISTSLHVVMLGSGLIFFISAMIFKRYVITTYGISKRTGKAENEHLQQRWAAVGQSVARFIHDNTDILVITLFLNMSMVAIYSLYALVTAGLDKIITSLATPVQSALGNLMAMGEEKLLRSNFIAYETVVHIFSIVLFSTAYIMILPFMQIYTSSFSNDNFIQPLLAMFILTSELVFCLRLPYETIIMAAGKFQETQKAAFIEAGLNLVVSIILIKFLGITGVVIGTLVSVLYRLIFFAVFLHQNILQLKYSEIIKRMTVSGMSVVLIVCAVWQWAQGMPMHTFIQWTAAAFVVTACASAITLVLHMFFYRKEVSHCIAIFYRLVKKKAL